MLFDAGKKPIIGVLHLPAFPSVFDEKRIDLQLPSIVQNLSSLQFGGCDAILIENDFEGPAPYGEFMTSAQSNTMHAIVGQLHEYLCVPFGFCCLLNDYKTAFALANSFGGSFVRLDTFVDAVKRVDDGVVLAPNPDEIISLKNSLGLGELSLWVDVHVKHTVMLDTTITLEESVQNALDSGADKIIITGNWTGSAPDIPVLAALSDSFGVSSFLVGSGVDENNISVLAPFAAGFIVGTSFKKDNNVDLGRVHVVCSGEKKSKETCLISSFSWDIISSDGSDVVSTEPGGPAHFLKKVLDYVSLPYDILSSNISFVHEYLKDGNSCGSSISKQSLILLEDKSYKNYIISTQLQEFDLIQLNGLEGANVYVDMQGYVSGESFGEMLPCCPPRAVWDLLSFVKCNERELSYLDEEFVSYIKLHAAFLVTRGSQGVTLYSNGKTMDFSPTKILSSIKDTLGAGDTFWGYFCSHHIEHGDVESAIVSAMQATELFLLDK